MYEHSDHSAWLCDASHSPGKHVFYLVMLEILFLVVILMTLVFFREGMQGVQPRFFKKLRIHPAS